MATIVPWNGEWHHWYVATNADGSDYIARNYEVTHWMPLPEPPKP